MSATIYYHDKTTGEYLGSATARETSGGKAIIPRYATKQQPPDAGDNEVAVFREGAWAVEADHRGTKYYDDQNMEHEVEAIGEAVPDGMATDPRPSEFHDLVDGGWVEDEERKRSVTEERCLREIDAAASNARARFISRGVGQEAVYLTKYEEARTYQAATNPVDSNYPYLNAEAQRRNMTVSALAQEVIDRRNDWTDPPGCKIEAERIGGKQDVRAAESADDKRAAADAAIATLDGITPA